MSDRDVGSNAQVLHERVREYARAPFESSSSQSQEFEKLALQIANFQKAHNPALQRLGIGRAEYSSLSDVPALPTDVYRRMRVACHSPEQDAVCFQTSGTTGGQGLHPVRFLNTYAQLSVAWGKRALALPKSRLTVLALAPPFEPNRTSSLSYMMERFVEQFDGRPLAEGASIFEPSEKGRWLVEDSDLDLRGFRLSVECAHRRDEPVLLLATSFALVWLLDELKGATVPLPSGSIVMHTGGFKGRTREVAPGELRASLSRALAVELGNIKSEYGMTELSSQLYDGGGGAIGDRGGHVYREPPWLRVDPVDPVSLKPVEDGRVGLARFTDLCNVDTSLIVLTQDRVRRQRGGVELLGRVKEARVRGCSVAIEALLNFPENGAPRQAAARASAVSGVARGGSLSARERIEALIGGAVQLVSPGSVKRKLLLSMLQNSTGLSRAGVVRALDECLELDPSDVELDALVQGVQVAPRAHVILPGRVFVATLRAVALALASSAEVFVRPSRREPVFARALAEECSGLFQVVGSLSAAEGDHIWAYGSDETIEALEKDSPKGLVWHSHGSGYGAVWVREKDWLAEAKRAPGQRSLEDAIARDVALFDQQGCLSPRIVFFEGSFVAAQQFAAELAQALVNESLRTPCGRLSRDELAAQTLFLAGARALGDVYPASPGVVSCSARPEPDASSVPPTGRNLEVRCVADVREAFRLHSPWLTALGCSSEESLAEASEHLPEARVSLVGQMQNPPFDGPVDRRTRG